MDFLPLQQPISMPCSIDADTENCPQNKRLRFQPLPLPTIASETNNDIATHTFSEPLLVQLSSQAPTLDEIHTDLLQVGMRVRKAVPEGYKTTRFTPRPFFNSARLSPATQAVVCGGNNAFQLNELSPYYAGGMHNVGGMPVQPIATATFCGINLAALSKYEGWSTGSRSQESLWTYTTSHKRSMDSDSDSDNEGNQWWPETPQLVGEDDMGMPVDNGYFNIGTEGFSDDMSDVSPFTQIHTRTHRRQNSLSFKQEASSMMEFHNSMHMAGRKLAKPKSRVMARNKTVSHTPMTSFSPFASMESISEYQDSIIDTMPADLAPEMTHAEVRDNSGFENAPFLQAREDVEMDCF